MNPTEQRDLERLRREQTGTERQALYLELPLPEPEDNPEPTVPCISRGVVIISL
jgi:hypothetical protein